MESWKYNDYNQRCCGSVELLRTQRQTISTEVIVAFIVQKESLVHQNIPLPEA
jgi:hypothetical protein